MSRKRAAARKPKVAAVIVDRAVDVTDERLRRDAWEWVNPAEIDSARQPIGRVRRMVPRTTLVDRLHVAGKLEWREHYAFTTWLAWLERSRGEPCVTGSYEPRGSRSADPPCLLPLGYRAEEARGFLSAVDEALPRTHITLIHRLADNVVRLPAGRAHDRAVSTIADVLCALATKMGMGFAR